MISRLTFIIDSEPRDGALNMAIDEVLLRTTPGPVLRTYKWARSALSFGYFRKYEEVAKHWTQRELVRRWTGGGEVPHGLDWTYSLIIPKSDPASELAPRESYAAIHECVRGALGISATLATEGAGGRFCFTQPVESDVMMNDEKVAGSAQRRTRHGLLHQGTVIVLNLGIDFGKNVAANLASKVKPGRITEAILGEAMDLAASKYGTDAWLKRR